GEQDRSRGDDPADGGDAAADRLSLGAALQPCLADAAEQKDAVVGRDREDERGQHERDGEVERALAGIAEQRFEAPVLEDQDQRPERRGQRERINQQCEKRRDKRAGEQKQDDQHRYAEQHDRQREVRADRAAFVIERGGISADKQREAGLEAV